MVCWCNTELVVFGFGGCAVRFFFSCGVFCVGQRKVKATRACLLWSLGELVLLVLHSFLGFTLQMLFPKSPARSAHPSHLQLLLALYLAMLLLLMSLVLLSVPLLPPHRPLVLDQQPQQQLQSTAATFSCTVASMM